MDKIMVRVSEAADLTSVPRSTAYALVASGIWPSVRLGTAIRIPVESLRAWVEAQAGAAQRNGIDASLAEADGVDDHS